MPMLSAANQPLAVCLDLTRAIARTRTVDEIFDMAIDALVAHLAVSRASILLFDPDGVMRFKAHRHLSEAYRRAVEGHTPWTPDSPNPQPIVVGDVREDASLAPYLETLQAEGIAAMAFIPLVSLTRVIGKFMLYYETPRALGEDELQLAGLIASQVAFAVERTRAEEAARRNEARLRFALDAASMGTWDWDLTANTVRWSDNLEAVHGLPPGTFDGTFASYEREIHPDDRERVLASARRALAEQVAHDVEYRIVAPDGTVRWVEGKGHVECENGRPVRMTGVCMNVTRRKIAEIERLASAEEANRLKDEFLATLSHELRTPLNAILGWVQILELGDAPSERVRQAVEVIGRNARMQAQLIEDVLDVSRIITGQLELDRVPVLIPQLVDSVVSGLLPTAHAKDVAVATDVPASLPPIVGDPKRLHQVFANVVSNAIKFTPGGGRVDIRAQTSGACVEITVCDTGIGIDHAFLPHVFDRFRQADSGSTRRHGGLGLGLAISRHLLELHCGEIQAESDGPGCGTTVTIRLPVRAHAGAHAPAGRAQAATADDLRLDGKTVVVVDDQHDAREVLRTILEGRGARVVLCVDAPSAVAALATPGADLLVADLAMPDEDGYDLIRTVRKRLDGLPAIAVSAYAHPQERSKAREAGYDGFCAKPIDACALARTIHEVLATAASRGL